MVEESAEFVCVCVLIMLLVSQRRDLSLSNWPRGIFVAYFTVVRALKVVHQLNFGNVEGERLEIMMFDG